MPNITPEEMDELLKKYNETPESPDLESATPVQSLPPDTKFGSGMPIESATPVPTLPPDTKFGQGAAYYPDGSQDFNDPGRYYGNDPRFSKNDGKVIVAPSLVDPNLRVSDRDPRDYSSPNDPTGANADRRALTRDYLSQKYGQAANSDKYDSAVAAQSRTNDIADVGHGLDRMFTSRAAAYGGQGADAGFWNGMKRDAAGRTQEAGDARKQKIADYLMKQKMGSEGVAEIDSIRKSDQQAAMYDPNSGVSRATRAGFKRMFADEVQNFPELEQMNAADIQGLMKDYEINAKMSIDRSLKEAQAQQMLTSEENKARELELRGDQIKSMKGKNDAEAEYLKARAKQVPIQAAGKQAVETNSGYELSPKDELKNYTDMQKDMVSARSKPELAQALRDRPAVLKAKQMIEQFRGNYDKMTKNEVALLDAEIAKIATGGVPHESFMKELDPKTAQSMVENFKQKWTNIPQGAELGAFVERRLKYLDDLDRVTNKIISDYGVRSYMAHEQGVSPEHKRQIQQNYPEIFSPFVVPTAKNDKAPETAQETKRLPDGSEWVKVNGGWKAK